MVTEILAYVFGGTSLVSIILFLIFYKQNRALKNNEVKSGELANKSSQIQTEMEKISLGTKYLEEIVAATEKIKSYQTDYQAGIESLSESIDGIKSDVKSIKSEVTLMSIFLNGDYERFKESINNIKE